MSRLIVFFRLFRAIFGCLAFLLVLHTLLRVCFIAYNPQLSVWGEAGETALVLGWGFALDLSAIILLNIPVVLFFFGSQYGGRSRGLLLRCSRVSFLLLNTLGLAINIIDIGYYKYNRHRSNIDLWYVLGDSASSSGSIVTHYWPLIGLFLVLVAALVWAARKLFAVSVMLPPLRWPVLAAIQLILAAMLFVGARGLGATPLMPASPLLNIDPARLPQAQNSIGTLFYSIARRHNRLGQPIFFKQEELDKLAGTHFFLGGATPGEAKGAGDGEPAGVTGREGADSMQKKNVVICILESFSRCYLTPGDPMKANTPFFDSLMGKSISFPNAHANGYSSNQGIVAILAGLPPFLDEPFYYSDYANTPLRSIGNILKEKGYNTNFFLGAGKDHFGFGKFTHMAGIDHYYSRADFNDDRFYDGNWGIFDEPFLQFGAHVLAGKPSPFLAVFFNITSHPPFTIPPQYQERFSFPGQTPAQRSISYTDHSFQEFFAVCRQAPWFRNTIFVFCADHWFDPYDGKGSYNYVNTSSIPIFIYDPSRDSGMVSHILAAQVDLTPTILDLMHYKGSYTGMGKSLLDSAAANNYSVGRLGEVYQIITGDYVLGYDLRGDKDRFLYRHSGDLLLGKDLLADSASQGVRIRLERILKANIQCYDQALTRRSLE